MKEKEHGSFDKLLSHLEDVELTAVHGRITEAVGTVIRCIIPNVKVGEICLIKRQHGDPLPAIVHGFSEKDVILSPMGDMTGIGPSSEVIPLRKSMHIMVGDGLLGRVLDGMGQPIDGLGPLENAPHSFPVHNIPPDPLKRKIIDKHLTTGVAAIDGVLTVGQGQRVGIFAAAGGGKSTLLGMIARNAEADVNVISLIGERGREVREFLEHDLGVEGLKKSVLIVSTSDQSAQMRINAAYVGTAIAEYFREKGKKVILMMDSVTRYARALREVGLAAGEPPARAGYTPSVFSTLPRLLERSGTSEHGSITAFYTILVAGDDMNEPVADEVRSILDGHIILSSDLARQNHYPAIDVLGSISRILSSITQKDQRDLITKVREVLANYKKIELLIKIGEYKPGSDPASDFANKYRDKVNNFLKQNTHDKFTFEQTLANLKKIFGP